MDTCVSSSWQQTKIQNCFSLTKLSSDANSSDEEISTRFFVPAKQLKSVTPRPNDVVCHTTDAQSGKFLSFINILTLQLALVA